MHTVVLKVRKKILCNKEKKILNNQTEKQKTEKCDNACSFINENYLIILIVNLRFLANFFF